MAAVIDLRRDLPKVREQYGKVMEALRTSACDYTAPCVVGAMVNPRKRRMLQNAEAEAHTPNSQVGTLLDVGLLRAPSEQRGDLIALQGAFDSGDRHYFESELKRVERKYLPTTTHSLEG